MGRFITDYIHNQEFILNSYFLFFGSYNLAASASPAALWPDWTTAQVVCIHDTVQTLQVTLLYSTYEWRQ